MLKLHNFKKKFIFLIIFNLIISIIALPAFAELSFNFNNRYHVYVSASDFVNVGYLSGHWNFDSSLDGRFTEDIYGLSSTFTIIMPDSIHGGSIYCVDSLMGISIGSIIISNGECSSDISGASITKLDTSTDKCLFYIDLSKYFPDGVAVQCGTQLNGSDFPFLIVSGMYYDSDSFDVPSISNNKYLSSNGGVNLYYACTSKTDLVGAKITFTLSMGVSSDSDRLTLYLPRQLSSTQLKDIKNYLYSSSTMSLPIYDNDTVVSGYTIPKTTAKMIRYLNENWIFGNKNIDTATFGDSVSFYVYVFEHLPKGSYKFDFDVSLSYYDSHEMTYYPSSLFVAGWFYGSLYDSPLSSQIVNSISSQVEDGSISVDRAMELYDNQINDTVNFDELTPEEKTIYFLQRINAQSDFENKESIFLNNKVGQINNSLDSSADKLYNLSDDMKVDKPDLSGIDLGADKLDTTTIKSIFDVFFGNELILVMLTLTCTFSLIGYLLFGKRS